MKTSYLIAAVMTLHLIPGCSPKSLPDSPPPPDPVTQLKNEIALVTTDRPQPKERWRNVKYDVQKTSSLVTPYSATLSAELFEIPSEIGVAKPDKSHSPVVDGYDITLAYQDDRWVLKTVKVKSKDVFAQLASWQAEEGDQYWESVKRQLQLH